MVFECLQFPPKNEQKQVNLRYHSSKVEFFCSFFGGDRRHQKPFRNYLTFNKSNNNYLINGHFKKSDSIFCFLTQGPPLVGLDGLEND